jgi:hypothetical protein
MIRSVIFGLALLAATLGPRTSGNSPYASALKPAPEAVAAATHCANKTCASVGGGCIQAAGYFCAKSGGQCFTRACQ